MGSIICNFKLTALLVVEAGEMLYEDIVEKDLDLQDLFQILALPLKLLSLTQPSVKWK